MNCKHVILLALAASLALTGCGGTVKRSDTSASVVAPLAAQKTKRATLALNDEVRTKLATNLSFNSEILLQLINTRLGIAGTLADDAPYSTNVVITDVRIRSGFSAVMWGFMAGDDHITGTVELRGSDGKVVHRFDVNASYAFGGFVGGQDGVRINWLYEKFSELVVLELRGTGQTANAPGGTQSATSAQLAAASSSQYTAPSNPGSAASAGTGPTTPFGGAGTVSAPRSSWDTQREFETKLQPPMD